MFFSKMISPLMGLASIAAAVPTTSLIERSQTTTALTKRQGLDCSNLAPGLCLQDCQHMSKIGFAEQGINAQASNGNIWVGDDGPYTFTFTNDASEEHNTPLTLVVWHYPIGDYQASFVNARQPAVTYSLENYGDSVTISAASDISGGWATLNARITVLSEFGQIYNTWGEFTTGAWATVDVSRLVNMGGNKMEVTVPSNGCVSDMDICSFHCKHGANECGEPDTYDLKFCDNGSQPGAAFGTYGSSNPEGGCQGWGTDGRLDISLRN
jgi:hypothetical protein